MQIQFLPNNMALFSNKEWRLISPANQGMRVYVDIAKYDQFNRLKNKARTDFNEKYLIDQLTSLNNRHGLTRSIVSKFKHQNLELQVEGGAIKYQMLNGCIFVGNFTYSTNKKDQAGLYTAEWNNSLEVYTTSASKNISAKHIAINGAFDSLKSVAQKMPEFIERGYKPETNQNTLKQSSYSIFYNNNGENIRSDMKQFYDSLPFTGGTQAAKKLSKLIKMEAKKDKEICWTLHEKGHALFKQALQLALKEMSHNEKVNLTKHKVFYANPTINLSYIDSLRKSAGMQLAPQAPLLNNYSIEQTWISGNFISETHISMRQLKEQGNNGLTNVTPGHIANNALSRAGMLALGGYAIPTSLGIGVAGWALTWATLGVSNLKKSNQKLIEGNADVINNFIK